MYLYELNFSVASALKVSPTLGAYLKRQEIVSVGELLEFYPTRYQDRSRLEPFPDLGQEGESLWLSQKATVTAHESFFAKGQPVLKIRFTNQAGQDGVLLCFNRRFLAKVLPEGAEFLVYGSFSLTYREWSTASFDFERTSGEASAKFGKIFPLYRGQTSVNSAYSKLVAKILARYLPILKDDVPRHLAESAGLMRTPEALREMHSPSSVENLELARRTLVVREIFWLQAGLAYQAKFFASPREPRDLSRSWVEQAEKSLPFSLTGDQQRAIREITQDLSGELPMNRLLQGDVGTGKTLVAFLSALPILERGEQVAFMAPTELLARQHLASFERLGLGLENQTAFLSGSLTPAQKKEQLEKIRSSQAKLVVGTHSLFSGVVEFANLSYVIVDEQHKFGLTQRERLLEKGFSPDLLLMSATPIPRTMALAVLGNTPISTLEQAPSGRLPITTYLVERENRERVYSFMAGELEKGNQTYFVHPVIEGMETGEIEDINSLFSQLQDRFPDHKISLLHSRLKESEKQEIIENFSSKKIDILLATSMVEVGMDVERATVMVISYAHRFGLASLHQLRGRVGRRNLPSFCFLVYTLPLEDESKERLKAIRESQDGFALAQKDLESRGSGNFRSEKQSGRLILTIANLEKDHSVFWSIKDQIPSFFREDSSLSAEVKDSVYTYLREKLKKQD